MPGFRFEETMAGTYARIDAPHERLPISFTIEARAESALRHMRDGRADIAGTLDMHGFAEGVPIEGTITILPLTRRIIRYEFRFTGDDGEPYRFEGQKNVRLLSLRRTLTELPANIYDADGNVVATAETKFDLRADLLPFLNSWRPA